MTISFVVHALLFLWFTSFKTTTQDLPIVTEVVLLEPGDLNPTAAAAPAPAPERQEQTVKGVSKPSNVDAHFIRMERSGDVALDPQVPNTFQDQLNSRLAAIQQNSPLPVGTVTGSPTASLFGSTPATVGTPGGSGTAPVKLNRGGGTGGPPLELSRGGTAGAPASLAPASIQAGKVGGGRAVQAGRRDGAAHHRGRVARGTDRGPAGPLLHAADLSGLGEEGSRRGSVTLYFVGAAGRDREGEHPRPEDGRDSAISMTTHAPRSARGDSSPEDGRTGEQWGTITFHFRLRSAG
jgi:hypothetical protein